MLLRECVLLAIRCVFLFSCTVILVCNYHLSAKCNLLTYLLYRDQQDFDNDGFFADVTIEPPSTNIAMIPPIVEPSDTIQIEPLPDVAVRRPRQRSEMTGSSTSTNVNASQLRPKIAQIGHDKVDSDDEGETLTDDMLLLQERVKLEKILCK